jgi:hypothetical protein
MKVVGITRVGKFNKKEIVKKYELLYSGSGNQVSYNKGV